MHGFTIGNALSQGFRVWIRNLVPFTLISAIFYVPLIIWASIGFHENMSLSSLMTRAMIITFAPIFINLFISGAITYGVVMELRGMRASFGACIAVGLRRFLPALGVAILVMLCVVGGTILLIIPGIILYCMLYVATQVSVMERPGLLGALKRSRHLTQNNKLNIFGLLIIAGLITGVPSKIIEKVIIPDPEHISSFSTFKTYIYVTLVSTMVIGVLNAVIASVTYFQLRQERDGTSIEEIARVFE